MGDLANATDELRKLATDLASWSQVTFGSDADRGPVGALKHLEKEAREAQAAWGGVAPAGTAFEVEMADCLILVLDAARRGGYGPMALVLAAQNKMAINKTRTWPKPTSDDPVEHVRGPE